MNVKSTKPRTIVKLDLTYPMKIALVKHLVLLLRKLQKKRQVFMEPKENLREMNLALQGQIPELELQAGPFVAELQLLISYDYILVTEHHLECLLVSGEQYVILAGKLYKDAEKSASTIQTVPNDNHHKKAGHNVSLSRHEFRLNHIRQHLPYHQRR